MSIEPILGQSGLYRDTSSGRVINVNDLQDFTMGIPIDGLKATDVFRGGLFLVRSRFLVLENAPEFLGVTMKLFVGPYPETAGDIYPFTISRTEGPLLKRLERLEAAVANGIPHTPFGVLYKQFVIYEATAIQVVFSEAVVGRLFLTGVYQPILGS